MKIAEARYRQCGGCGSKTRITSEVYGCDNCRKTIDLNKKGVEYLEATVFRQQKEAQHMHFCSWRCCLTSLRKVKTDYFISLPFLHYDSTGRHKGMRAQDFFALIGRRSRARGTADTKR